MYTVRDARCRWKMNWRLTNIALLIALLLALCSATATQAQSSQWPQLAKFTKTLDVDVRSPRTMIRLQLLDVQRKPQYRLVCFAGNEDANNSAGGFIYSGGLLCGFAPLGTRLSELLENRSLLSTDTDTGAAIYSRGNFNPEEIVGACAKYPDFGLVRTLRLRGFRLVLTLSRVHVDPDYKGGIEFPHPFTNETRENYPIGRVKLSIEVTPDPSAQSAQALPSKYVDPKGNQEVCARRRN